MISFLIIYPTITPRSKLNNLISHTFENRIISALMYCAIFFFSGKVRYLKIYFIFLLLLSRIRYKIFFLKMEAIHLFIVESPGVKKKLWISLIVCTSFKSRSRRIISKKLLKKMHLKLNKITSILVAHWYIHRKGYVCNCICAVNISGNAGHFKESKYVYKLWKIILRLHILWILHLIFGTFFKSTLVV